MPGWSFAVWMIRPVRTSLSHVRNARVPRRRIPMTPRRNRIFALTLLAALAVLPTPARAAKFVYYCIMSPLQESGGSPGSHATGAGRFEIDTDAGTCSYRIVFSRLLGVETAAHIHGDALSSPGHNAGVLVGLPAGNPKVGVWNFDNTQQTLLLKGLCYANIHSTLFPGGEIRGQIVPLNATLDGAQETPAVSTHGRGFATFTIDTTANVLSYYVQFDSLNSGETAAHIHGHALHAAPAGVLVALPAGSPKIGTWNYPQSEERALLTGLDYVNIHTVTSGGGEIRGQILPVVVPIDALQETPPTSATGSAGFGLVSIDTSAAAHKLSYDLHIDSLGTPEAAAHIHGRSEEHTPELQS